MPASFDFKREGGGSGLLPNGVYRIIIEDAQDKTGPSGYPYVNLKIRVMVKGKKSGMPIYETLSTSPEARFRVEQFFDAVGAPESGNAGSRWFKGKSCWATLKSEEYQGTWRNKVAQYLDDDAAQELIEKMANPDDDDDDDDEVEETPVRKSATKKKASPKIDEMEEEEVPF